MRKIFGKVLQSKRLRGIENRAKKAKTTTMIIFYSDRAKRLRNFFGNLKVLQSKRLRGIKKEQKKKQKKKQNNYNILP